MELLKANPIIDDQYKPALDQTYLEYFKRAMVFAQTNYSEQIKKVQKTRFRVLSATNFFEEYAWTICCQQDTLLNVSNKFMHLSKHLAPFYNSFWDLNSFPKLEAVREGILKFENEQTLQALFSCADTVNRGIKLFGWDHYKENFLNTPEKLCVLPMLGISGANKLARNVGLNSNVVNDGRLYPLVKQWGFSDTKELCNTIYNYVPMEPRIIELILWYSVVSFDHNTKNS